ncbi:MAG: ABC transporter ATP-binding protein [Mesorhizobium amorphae]|nr:MAG: ABC transporter ATP-binding protein [Mesorhizobium amorphae]
MGEGTAARLAFEQVSHRFASGVETLRDVSLAAEPGEVLCLLGPSGSGKTTLLRVAAGIEPQSMGRVLLDGRELGGPAVFVPPEQRSIGLVFQDFALFPHLSILDNVRFGLKALPREEGRHRALDALERVGLERHAASFPHKLSGGEQQRAALARALVPRPKVILMDEPFSGLDARLKDSVRSETLAILRSTNTTVILVTHDAEEAMRMGDRIALLRHGRLVQHGRPEELYRRPGDLFTASFFSEINVLEARVAGGVAQTPLGPVPASGLAEGSPASIAVRLEGFALADSGEGCEARILSRRYLGASELLEFAVAGCGQPIRARFRAGTVSSTALDIRIRLLEADAVVFETGRDIE